MKVAIYCRLSEEDRNKQLQTDDSESIQNQKTMLRQYSEAHGWDIYDIYSDDDYTGADRKRPEFNRLLSDAEKRRFDIILCKTQSRFTSPLIWRDFLFPFTAVSALSTMLTKRIPHIGNNPWIYFSTSSNSLVNLD